MHSQHVHTLILFISLILSLFVVIAAAKYAEWAYVMVEGSRSSAAVVLIFYIGTVPVYSLVYATVYIVLLHLDIIPSFDAQAEADAEAGIKSPTMGEALVPMGAFTTLLVLAIFQLAGWLIQASLCTACELRPILIGHEGQVPLWCPQSHFRDNGNVDLPGMLAKLATVKDFTQWFMVLLSGLMVECARRQWARGRAREARKAKEFEVFHGYGSRAR